VIVLFIRLTLRNVLIVILYGLDLDVMGLKDDLQRLTRFSNFRKQVASKTNEQNESTDNIWTE
jgi:hypothetical protein